MAELLAANQITIAKVLDGEQGIPGEPGADGKTSYFHIKYSAVANPTSSSEMSETPLAYIGTYVDFTEADSTDPTKYTWSRFEGIQGEKGEQGIPGIGTDGKTSYLHIAYATSADGSEGFSISESSNKTYIGQYTDFVSTDSTDYTKYAWTKIKGEMSPEQVAQLNKASQDASDAVSKAEAINSKGEQLVINGNAILGNNTNFTQWLYDGSMANGSGGSFTLSPGTGKVISNDEFFGLDPSKDYRFEFDAISKDSTSKHYSMLVFYDIDKYKIGPWHHMYLSEVTELAVDLKNGDTVVHLNDISSFNTNTGTATYNRGFIFWNYTNSFGYTYPPKTYSRNIFNNLWEDSGVNKADNTITLKSPWSKGTVPAGTKLSQCSDGTAYKYQPLYYSVVPSEWTHYSCVYSGTDYSGTNISSKFPPGTAYCKVGFLWNYNDSSTDQLWITNVSVYEDYKTGIANVQTGVDSLNDTVFGARTFEYILDGVTIPAHKREDGTYYYILNDEEVTVAESNLVHDSDGNLVSYQDGGVYESLDNMSENIGAIGTKVNSFDARETAIYNAIQDNSLIARKNARVEGNSLIITNDTATEAIANLLNYLQLNADSIVIYGNGKDIVTIAKTADDSGYMKMNGTSMLQAQESRLSTIRLRSAGGTGNLALVAGSDGHISLREVL